MNNTDQQSLYYYSTDRRPTKLLCATGDCSCVAKDLVFL